MGPASILVTVKSTVTPLTASPDQNKTTDVMFVSNSIVCVCVYTIITTITASSDQNNVVRRYHIGLCVVRGCVVGQSSGHSIVRAYTLVTLLQNHDLVPSSVEQKYYTLSGYVVGQSQP